MIREEFDAKIKGEKEGRGDEGTSSFIPDVLGMLDMACLFMYCTTSFLKGGDGGKRWWKKEMVEEVCVLKGNLNILYYESEKINRLLEVAQN